MPTPVIEEVLYAEHDYGVDPAELAFASWSPNEGDLLLLLVGIKDSDDFVSSVAGNGQTWQRLFRHDDVQLNNKIDVWYAVCGPSPTAGSVVGQCGDDGAEPNDLNTTQIGHLLRISGADTTAPLPTYNSADTGATDTSTISVSLTTTVDNALVLGMTADRGAPFTIGFGGWVAIRANDVLGSGGNVVSFSSYELEVATSGSNATFNGSMTSARDWVAAIIEVSPTVVVGDVFTGDIAQILPSLQQSASGTNVEPVDVGTIAQTLPTLGQDASGSVSDPVYEGSTEQTLGLIQQSANGTVDVPVYEGTSAQTLSTLEQSATGTYVEPVDIGSIAQTLSAIQQDASGTFVEPQLSGDIAQTLPTLSQDATGEHNAPVYSGTASSTLGLLSASAAGSVADPVDVGAIAQTLPALSQDATGGTQAPAYEGSVTSTLGALQQSGSGTFATPVGSDTIVSVLAPLEQSATGSITAPLSVDPGYLDIITTYTAHVVDIQSPVDKQKYVVTVPLQDAYLDVVPAQHRQLVAVQDQLPQLYNIVESDANKVDI